MHASQDCDISFLSVTNVLLIFLITVPVITSFICNRKSRRDSNCVYCFVYQFPKYYFYGINMDPMDELHKEMVGRDLGVTLPTSQLKVYCILNTIKVLSVYQCNSYSMHRGCHGRAYR